VSNNYTITVFSRALIFSCSCKVTFRVAARYATGFVLSVLGLTLIIWHAVFWESDFWINFMGFSWYEWILDSGTFILFAHIWFGWLLVALFPFSFHRLFWPVICLLLCIVLLNEDKWNQHLLRRESFRFNSPRYQFQLVNFGLLKKKTSMEMWRNQLTRWCRLLHWIHAWLYAQTNADISQH